MVETTEKPEETQSPADRGVTINISGGTNTVNLAPTYNVFVGADEKNDGSLQHWSEEEERMAELGRCKGG